MLSAVGFLRPLQRRKVTAMTGIGRFRAHIILRLLHRFPLGFAAHARSAWRQRSKRAARPGSSFRPRLRRSSCGRQSLHCQSRSQKLPQQIAPSRSRHCAALSPPADRRQPVPRSSLPPIARRPAFLPSPSCRLPARTSGCLPDWPRPQLPRRVFVGRQRRIASPAPSICHVMALGHAVANASL